jgi:uncharacterized protein
MHHYSLHTDRAMTTPTPLLLLRAGAAASRSPLVRTNVPRAGNSVSAAARQSVCWANNNGVRPISSAASTSGAAEDDVKTFVLRYEYVDNMLERRAPHRAAHLAHAGDFQEGGKEARLLLGGALIDPVDTGLIVFRGKNKDAVEAFARSDPYVKEGLVTNWEVREWLVVAGSLA